MIWRDGLPSVAPAALLRRVAEWRLLARWRGPAVLAAAVLLSSCGRRETPVEAGQREGILHQGLGAEPRTLDPHKATASVEFQVILSLWEGLVAHGPDDDPGAVPGLAESWETDSGGTRWTFHLRPTARWSNGDRVAAEDFLFSLRRLLHPATASPHAPLAFVLRGAEAWHKDPSLPFSSVGVRAPDAATLQFDLLRPVPYFLGYLLHPAWLPLHPGSVAGTAATGPGDNSDWAFPGKLVGTGSYVLASWIPGSRLVAAPNPYYWDAGQVRLRQIHFYPMENADTEEQSWRNGLLHITDDLPHQRRSAWRSSGNPAYREHPVLATTYFLFNTTRPPLDQPAVRRALALAIDRQALTENIVQAGQPATRFSPGALPGYPPPEETLFNPALARDLLSDAGFPGGRGFRPLELSTGTADTTRQVTQAVQQMWRDHLGIEVRLLQAEFRAYLESLNQGDFDLGYLAWYGDYVDPYAFLSVWEADSFFNRARWRDPAYDRLLQAANAEHDPDVRLPLLAQAEAVLLNSAPIAPVFWVTQPRLVHPSVIGWEPKLLDLHAYKHVFLRQP